MAQAEAWAPLAQGYSQWYGPQETWAAWQQSAGYEAQAPAPPADEPTPPGDEQDVQQDQAASAAPQQQQYAAGYDAAAYAAWQANQQQQQQQQQQADAWSRWHHQQGYAHAHHGMPPAHLQGPAAPPAPTAPGPAAPAPQPAATAAHRPVQAPSPSGQAPSPWSRQPAGPSQPHQLAASAATQPRPSVQSGRPLAQAGVDFRVRPRMPRSFAQQPPPGRPAGSASSAAQRPAAGQPQFVSVDGPRSQAAAAAGPAPSSAASSGAAANSWPPSLRDFVTRALKTALPNQKNSTAMHVALKAVIAREDAAGRRWAHDWDTEPIPSLGSAGAQVGATGTLAGIGAGARQAGNIDRRRAQLQDEPSPRDKRGRAAVKAGSRQRKRLHSPSPSPSSSDDSPAGGAAASPAELAASRARNARFGDGAVQGGRTLTAAERKHRRARIAAVAETGIAEEQDWSRFVVRGTSQQLEKSYFRLTAAPEASDVRPEPVLRRALERLVALLDTEQAHGQVKYLYAMDQFKGMRQDLTVQHMGGQIAVDIYEASARAALEHEDLPEYQQCQARLDSLYTSGVQGCKQEFLAYRILYQVAHAAQAGGAAALLSTLRLVDAQAAEHPAVAHAMSVRKRAGMADGPGLCALYAAAPGLGRALLDLMLPRTRFAALKAMVGAFNSPLPLAHLAALLGFCAEASRSAGQPSRGQEARQARRPQRGQSWAAAMAGTLPGCTRRVFQGKHAAADQAEDGVEACRQWLLDHGAVLVSTPSSAGEFLVDCKASRGQLAVPETRDAVAHGDVNIDVTDFLKSL